LRQRAVRTACSKLRRNSDAGDLGPGLESLGPGGSILGGGRLMAVKLEQVADPVMGRQEALRLAGYLKRFICRSRRRVGWCEFSALLFSPLCFLCSTEGMISRLAAP